MFPSDDLLFRISIGFQVLPTLWVFSNQEIFFIFTVEQESTLTAFHAIYIVTDINPFLDL
ncbi:MAG: hypothetical protein HXS46_11230 [Theionarchaea archaeon]|nr:hypothetical protein [Theionarchaea archaeon]